jgi:ubiquinone biosynthesis protein COQ4
MAGTEKDYSYFHKGIQQLETQSSVLISSSKYLNSPELRDWIATHFMRRNGVDFPVPPDTTYGLIQALEKLRDMDQIQQLIEREKTLNPKFKKWIEARFLCKMKKEDFAQYDKGTLGGEYYRYLVDYGFEMNLSGMYQPRNDLEFIFLRFGQIHDWEHLISGGQFTSLGEIIPYFVRLSNTHQHFTPDMAQLLCEMYMFGGFRMVMRGGLHYPTAWLTIADSMRRGLSIGLASESIIMMDYESAFHLPIEEARKRLGVVNAEELETVADDQVYTEQRKPTEEELTRIGRDDLRSIRL